MEELQANINNVPKFLPEEAISWMDTVSASVEDCVIKKTTIRIWKMPGGKTVKWVKESKRVVEMEPQDDSEFDGIDMEEFEREFQAKLDFCAQVTLERQLIRMVKSKKV